MVKPPLPEMLPETDNVQPALASTVPPAAPKEIPRLSVKVLVASRAPPLIVSEPLPRALALLTARTAELIVVLPV